MGNYDSVMTVNMIYKLYQILCGW